jgi:hypothetical protein
VIRETTTTASLLIIKLRQFIEPVALLAKPMLHSRNTDL